MDGQIRAPWWRTWIGIGGLGLLALTGVYLSMAHTDRVLAALPYLAVLACPLMHLLMGCTHGKDGKACQSKKPDEPK